MNCAPFDAHTTVLFKNYILRFADIINVESCIFLNNCFNKDSFSIFDEKFKLISTTHSFNTTSVRTGIIFVPSYTSVRFRKSQFSLQSLLHGNKSKTSSLNIILYV